MYCGAPRIDIGPRTRFEGALLEAKSIVLSTSVSGIYLANFRETCIYKRLEPKIERLPGSGRWPTRWRAAKPNRPPAGVEWLGVAGVESSGRCGGRSAIAAISAGLNSGGAPDAR